ncbi:MAG: tetratricopeptide repeat protein [Acidobacteriota bacterium]
MPPDAATSLNNLAALYSALRKYKEVEFAKISVVPGPHFPE